jgi:hypothetical protein
MSTLDADRLALAKRIARHAAPGQLRPVDKALLVKTANRLQRTAEVVKAMPCDPREN